VDGNPPADIEWIHDDTAKVRDFQVLTAASMDVTVFWDIATCRLVEFDVSEVLTSLQGAISQKTLVFKVRDVAL
jgi:hypothetical protein